MIGDVRAGDLGIILAVVKGVVQVVCHKIGAFEKKVDVVRPCTFCGVVDHCPCRVFGRGPVEFRGDVAAKLGDCVLDGGVDAEP